MASLFESLARRYTGAAGRQDNAQQTGSQPVAAPAAVPVAAEPAPQATTGPSVLDAPAAQPVTLAVVTGHKDSRAAQILAGVVGVRREGAFVVDPTYAQVSYLFTLASSGAMGAGAALADISLPSAQAGREFLINMLAANGEKWGQMYDQVAQSMGQQGDLIQNMLAAERANVAAAAQRVIDAAGLTAYDCPVTYQAVVPQTLASDRADVTTEAQLAALGQAVPSSVRAMPSEGRGVHLQAQASPELAAATKAFDGSFELEVNGVAKVLASSPENAQFILDQMLLISRNSLLQNVLTLTPLSVNNVTLIPYNEDTDDDSEFDRDN